MASNNNLTDCDSTLTNYDFDQHVQNTSINISTTQKTDMIKNPFNAIMKTETLKKVKNAFTFVLMMMRWA